MQRYPRALIRRWIPVIAAICVLPARAVPLTLDQQFAQTVRPFVTQYCAGCHSGATPMAQFNLSVFTTPSSVVQDLPHWSAVVERLTANEMPPKGMPQPPAELRQQVINWVKAMRLSAARKNAGDPGLVLARRLSNAEYDYTIRDLTGVDMRPTKEFPIDPTNPEGFDNSGESLTMSPELLNKYLQSAREVSEHLALTPDGFNFAPYPMLVMTDREKYSVERIVNFYLSQPTDYADYFQAAWSYKRRAQLGKPTLTLARAAADAKVSAKYLPMIWRILGETPPGAAPVAAKQEVGPVGKLQAMWKALPAPIAGKPDADLLRAKCIEMRDFVIKTRSRTAMQFSAPVVSGRRVTAQPPLADSPAVAGAAVPAGRGGGSGRGGLPEASQPLLTWKFNQFNTHRRNFDPAALRNDTDPPLPVPEIPKYAALHGEAAPRWAALTQKSRVGDMDLVVPAAERPRYEASFARFASVFPDVFYVSERGKFFPDNSADAGRLLSAGYHNVMGFWRDDNPLMELILDDKGQKELNRLWLEFEFLAEPTKRTWTEYFFNQGGEVDNGAAEAGRVRPVGREVTDESVILEIRDLYIAKAIASDNAVAAAWMPVHFNGIDNTLRSMEKLGTAAESKHLEALLKLASRAYRRPLSKVESDDIVAYYRTLRAKGGLTHEEAMRDSIVGVLVSPDFFYRIDLQTSAPKPSAESAAGIPAAASSTVPAIGSPLSAIALASRLSYFLWSSMPDQELLAHATSGDLLNRDVLLAQARRMMKDDRSRGLATEFAANWLDFRRFETYNAVDRDRFPSFDNDLRQAMFEEPIRFVQNVIQRNSSVFDMLYGNYTFVNRALAKHYGMPGPPEPPVPVEVEVTAEAKATKSTPEPRSTLVAKVRDDDWIRIDNAHRYQRGGLLPMAVFLTQGAPGLRTSPVKRGYWLVRRVLGEVIPSPPPVVPELPKDESTMILPVRATLEKHRANPACASCHARFDVFGLSFEGYGMVGETRTTDLAGRAVDTKAVFPGGMEGDGLKGVQAYIKERRQTGYLDNLSRKLLAYALSRSLMISDELTVERTKISLTANDYRFGSMVEAIVTSPQFLNKRNANTLQKKGE